MVRKTCTQPILQMLWTMSFKRKTRSWLEWEGLGVSLPLGPLTLGCMRMACHAKFGFVLLWVPEFLTHGRTF